MSLAAGSPPEAGGAMSVAASPRERLLQAALHSYLDDFGHEEADVLRDLKALIAKLPRTD